MTDLEKILLFIVIMLILLIMYLIHLNIFQRNKRKELKEQKKSLQDIITTRAEILQVKTRRIDKLATEINNSIPIKEVNTSNLVFLTPKGEVAKYVVCRVKTYKGKVTGITPTIRKKGKKGFENIPVNLKIIGKHTYFINK